MRSARSIQSFKFNWLQSTRKDKTTNCQCHKTFRSEDINSYIHFSPIPCFPLARRFPWRAAAVLTSRGLSINRFSIVKAHETCWPPMLTPAYALGEGLDFSRDLLTVSCAMKRVRNSKINKLIIIENPKNRFLSFSLFHVLKIWRKWKIISQKGTNKEP